MDCIRVGGDRTADRTDRRAGDRLAAKRLSARRAAALLSTLALPFSAAAPAAQESRPAEARRYVLLPESRFEVHTKTAGLLGRLGDEHVVRAHGFSGTVCYVPGNPGASWVEVIVPVDSLEILTPVDSADRASIRRSMRERVLRADRFPFIRLASREVVRTDGGLRLTADLTLAGETRPVTIELGLQTAGDGLWAWGTFAIRQSDFGIRPFSAALGTVRVADEVAFFSEARARREAGECGDRAGESDREG